MDITDFNMLTANFGTTAAVPMAIPEPHAIVLLFAAIGCIALTINGVPRMAAEPVVAVCVTGLCAVHLGNLPGNQGTL